MFIYQKMKMPINCKAILKYNCSANMNMENNLSMGKRGHRILRDHLYPIIIPILDLLVITNAAYFLPFATINYTMHVVVDNPTNVQQ